MGCGKTELHLYQQKIRQQQALSRQGSFKPKITPYSQQLRRKNPFTRDCSKKEKVYAKAAKQREVAIYDQNTGRKLFHPKVTRPSRSAQIADVTGGSPVGKNVSVVAGQRLYRHRA